MIRKVIWIRCYETSEAEQIEEDILGFIKEDSSLSGDIPVKIYSSKVNGVYDLSHIYDMSEIAVNVLKEKYGDENVKMSERKFSEDYARKSVGERIAESLERIADVAESLERIADVAETLERIADCLDNIDSNISYLQGSMECLEEITECIVQPGTDGYGKYLRIIGSVSTSDN